MKKIFLRFIPLSFLAFFIFPLHTQEKSLNPDRISFAPCKKNCFTVNFKDVELHDWLKTMSGLIRRNILVDDSVKGKITVISSQKVSQKRAFSFMKQVLEIKGYSVIEEPDLIKVVPLAKARYASLPSGKDPNIFSSGVISRLLSMPDEIELKEISAVIKSVAGAEVNITNYAPTNSIVLTGFSRNVLRAIRISNGLIRKIQKSDNQVKSSNSVHIYYVRHMKAESLAGVLKKLDTPYTTQSSPGQKAKTKTKIQAVAHKESNSIVVTANPSLWSEIKKIVTKLDTKRSQILLEVLIAEVQSGKNNDFGIDWRLIGQNNIPTAQFNEGVALESGIVDPQGNLESNPLARNRAQGFSLGFLNPINGVGSILGILKATVGRNNFKVLSSPQILSLDNQEAEINVGQDVPIQTLSRSSGTTDTITNSFEYRPTGIKIKMTPHVNPSGQISLEFFGEITNIQGQATAAVGGNPIFSKRNVKTYVTVLNQQTIVIGGLIQSQKDKRVRKIPFLGDIPLLGYLFRRTIDNISRTNLMIFITPHILDSREKADQITGKKQRAQRRAQEKQYDEIIVWPEP